MLSHCKKSIFINYLLQISLIKHPIKETIDNTIHTKKNAPKPTLNIDAIVPVEISMINRAIPANNVPIIDASKHPPILHMHLSNPLHFPNAFAPNTSSVNIIDITAAANNATTANVVTVASNPFVNTIPAIIPMTILINTSIIHVPLQNLLQVYSSILSSPPLIY